MTENEKADAVHEALMADFDEMSLRNLSNQGSLKAASKNFKLPSVEQMKREVETGEFSPESIAIANSILESADPDLHSELPEAELANETLMRNYSDLTDHERDLLKSRQAQKRARSRAWREEATKSITPATAHFKKIATEAKKTTKAFKKINKAIPQKPAPGAKLQHRPFLILSAIRDEL